MTTIYLARHGQTEENLMRIFQGHLPGTLTADGIEQGRARFRGGSEEILYIKLSDSEW